MPLPCPHCALSFAFKFSCRQHPLHRLRPHAAASARWGRSRHVLVSPSVSGVLGPACGPAARVRGLAEAGPWPPHPHCSSLPPSAESLSSPCLPASWTEAYGAWAFAFAVAAILVMQLLDFIIEAVYLGIADGPGSCPRTCPHPHVVSVHASTPALDQLPGGGAEVDGEEEAGQACFCAAANGGSREACEWGYAGDWWLCRRVGERSRQNSLDAA